MKVIFLGTGEAFDENNPNNSHLVISKKAKLLLDCGFITPYQLWKYNDDQSFLDGVYITHLHADHYFGLPALFYRMVEEGRKKRLIVICHKGFVGTIKSVIKHGYKNLLSKLSFDLKFMEINSGDNIKFKDLKLSFAETKHSRDNLAIKIDNGKKSVCYSGDGMFIKQTEKLYKDSDLVIQETYLYDKRIISHSSVVDAIKMAERNNVKCLALTHINRKERPKIIKKKPSSKKVKIIIPKVLQSYQL